MNLIPDSFFFDKDIRDILSIKEEMEQMKCDIYEQNDIYYLEMDIPGFKKEEINLEIKDGYLTIEASKDEVVDDENKTYIRKERNYSSYSRSFDLVDINEEDIEAKFENGTLFITIPKLDESLIKRTIEIK